MVRAGRGTLDTDEGGNQCYISVVTVLFVLQWGRPRPVVTYNMNMCFSYIQASSLMSAVTEHRFDLSQYGSAGTGGETRHGKTLREGRQNHSAGLDTRCLFVCVRHTTEHFHPLRPHEMLITVQAFSCTLLQS